MTLKLHTARKMLRGAGFAFIKVNGRGGRAKHEKWQRADGVTITLPHHPKGDGIFGFLEQKVRRYASGEGTVYERGVNGNDSRGPSPK